MLKVRQADADQKYWAKKDWQLSNLRVYYVDGRK